MVATANNTSKGSAAKAFIQSGVSSRGSNPAEELQRRVAQAAYYRAEQRGFQPGHELEDWLAAEKDVMQARVI